MKNRIVTIYADPVTRTGLPAQAEILKVLHDYGILIHCEVRMTDTGIICNMFVNKSEPSPELERQYVEDNYTDFTNLKRGCRGFFIILIGLFIVFLFLYVRRNYF